MFYCDPCGNTRGWPTDEFTHMMTESYGRCEICGKVAACCDVPSKRLPIRSETAPPADMNRWRN